MSNMSDLDIVCQNLGLKQPTMEQVRLVAAMDYINNLLRLNANMQWKDLTVGAPDLNKSDATDTELLKMYNSHQPRINVAIPKQAMWLPVCRPCLEDSEVPHLKLPYAYELCLEPHPVDNDRVNYVLLIPYSIEEDNGVMDGNTVIKTPNLDRIIISYLVEVTRLRFELVESQNEAETYARENKQAITNTIITDGDAGGDVVHHEPELGTEDNNQSAGDSEYIRRTDELRGAASKCGLSTAVEADEAAKRG